MTATETIIAAVTETFQMSARGIRGPMRTVEAVDARSAAAFIMTRSGMKHREIAVELKRGRSAICQSAKRCANIMSSCSAYKTAVESAAGIAGVKL